MSLSSGDPGERRRGEGSLVRAPGRGDPRGGGRHRPQGRPDRRAFAGRVGQTQTTFRPPQGKDPSQRGLRCSARGPRRLSVKVLLDTRAFFWFSAGDGGLRGSARRRIEDIGNDKFLSVASIWEVAIKVSLGKLELEMSIDELIDEGAVANGFF